MDPRIELAGFVTIAAMAGIAGEKRTAGFVEDEVMRMFGRLFEKVCNEWGEMQHSVGHLQS